MIELRSIASRDLSRAELAALRQLLDQAFGDRFDDGDWRNTLGGLHVLAIEDRDQVAHAAVVDRTLIAGGRPLRTGYVEGVATRPDRRRRGLAALVMREADRIILEGYQLGGLSDGTGVPGFYARLGWERWQGPTFVAAPHGPARTADDDGSVMVLRTPTTGGLDLSGSLTCDWRPGDAW
ncbi:MAG TPA: GNAT family N-acetyltransferase [Actinomycetota bacterium]|jgi:aminoglycoside 2'-N-acetyltransferase I|nr:GNAT family N-acetyltransferase [Actinomycetota bacterium]